MFKFWNLALFGSCWFSVSWKLKEKEEIYPHTTIKPKAKLITKKPHTCKLENKQFCMQLHQIIDSSCISNILVQRADIIRFSQIAGDIFSC